MKIRQRKPFSVESGFTIIELLIVTAIIGVLVTVVIVAINPVKQIQNSQDAKARSNMQAFKAAYQLYYNDNKYYPTTLANGTAVGGCWSSGSCSGTVYMRSVPSQPQGSVAYLYSTTANCDNSSIYCTDYIIGAKLYDPIPGSDSQTLTACGNLSGANYEVCND